MMQRTKLFAISSPETADLERIFLGSLKDDWDVEIVRQPSFGGGNGDFRSESYFNALNFKVRSTLDLICKNLGRTIILSDIDIEFFRKCDAIIRAGLRSHDVLFQSEYWPSNGTINSGFVVIRCNERTLSFWEKVNSYSVKDFPLGDQSIINMLLRDSRCQLSWGMLPNAIYAQSHHFWPLSIALYHANCTNGTASINRKIRQLEAVRTRVTKERLFGYRAPSLFRGVMQRVIVSLASNLSKSEASRNRLI